MAQKPCSFGHLQHFLVTEILLPLFVYHTLFNNIIIQLYYASYSCK